MGADTCCRVSTPESKPSSDSCDTIRSVYGRAPPPAAQQPSVDGIALEVHEIVRALDPDLYTRPEKDARGRIGSPPRPLTRIV